MTKTKLETLLAKVTELNNRLKDLDDACKFIQKHKNITIFLQIRAGGKTNASFPALDDKASRHFIKVFVEDYKKQLKNELAEARKELKNIL